MAGKKKILLIVLAILIIIQFIRPAKNQSIAPTPADVFTVYPAADSVQQIVRTACYNCHSNNTVYPWYDNIQPVGWWLNNHIKEGKRELNFSEFANFTPKRKDNKLKKIGEELKEKGMPLPSYLWVHKEARLTDPQREAIINWAAEAKKQLNYKK
jgi:hypothetical protein